MDFDSQTYALQASRHWDDFDLSATIRRVLSHPLTAIAGLSAYSYFIALTRVFVYCVHFGIPLNLVPPISRSLWVSTFAVLLIGLLAVGSLVFVYASLALTRREIVLRIQGFFLGSLLFFIVFLGVLYPHWIAALFATVVVWLGLILGLEIWRKKRGDLFDIQGRVRRDKLRAWTRLRLQWGGYLVVGIFLLAIAMGLINARKTQFEVLCPQDNGEPKLVVLYSDGEHFICAPFQKQETERTFVLLDRSQISQEEWFLRMESIGPLHPVPVPTSRKQHK